LALAYPGTTPHYWMEVDDVLIVTALDVLDQRAQAQARARRG
jgi:hypothetical protein